jgi:hypothetical protein
VSDLPNLSACGLFLGVGLALFLEYMDSRVGTPEAVWRATAVPTLGVVPHMKALPRRAYSHRRLPRRASLNGLDAMRARILRVVLNGVDLRDPAYADYRSYYRSYYSSLVLVRGETKE